MNDLIKLLRGQRIDGRSTDEIMHFAANEIESLRSQLSYRIEERDDTNRNLTAALRREAAYKDRLAEAEGLLIEGTRFPMLTGERADWLIRARDWLGPKRATVSIATALGDEVEGEE